MNNKSLKWLFQYGFKIIQKVLIPCEFSINLDKHCSIFICFHIPNFWDVTAEQGVTGRVESGGETSRDIPEPR
jgi:hypothetical protein